MSANLRKITLELIRSYEEEGRYVNLLLSTSKVKALSADEKAIVTSLLYTTVEKKLTYDYFISAFAKRQISDVDPYVRDVLRLGLCQIIDMDSVPDFAAVNETVKLARHGGERGFINAILRRAVKEKDNLPYPDKKKNHLRYLSVYHSVPLATVKYFASLFGEEECEKLLSAFSSKDGFSITVNERKISREELLRKLADFSAEKSRYSSNGISFKKSLPPKTLTGFDTGDFFVQDEASRIASAALDARTGETVIDVCSAPGGKALAAAIRVGDAGEVYAFDLHESKLSLIEESKKRLGLTNIKIGTRDATEPDESLFGKAERVICDVPCSGLGVFAKKPDLRYKDLAALDTLPPLQYAILEASSGYLKLGGVLVYSTCTINPEENEKITDKFISLHPEFTYEGFSVGELSASEGKITLLPHKHGTDGFYIAKLRKNND
ncbi:MAG: 16S rRNA (cytosine(967)-C(5))-methyltransferase RsmB [Clostridia bacterium]|nr:16S rRNA (cytosine(967)-C(5))-methyltransferase RsmB [Clostridia bacterium]